MIKVIFSFCLNNYSSVCFLNAEYRNNLYLVSWIRTLNKHPGFRFIRTFEEKSEKNWAISKVSILRSEQWYKNFN